MNYDHIHMTYEFWDTNIRPNIRQLAPLQTFDFYLKEFSLTNSGKWLRDSVNVKLFRPPIAIEPETFLSKYKDKCVVYNPPFKPEEGQGRIIYQLSPTFHMETTFWAWIENNVLHSYGSCFICYTNDEELKTFLDDIKPFMRKGNTEDRNSGFAGLSTGGMLQPAGFQSGLTNQNKRV